MTAASSQSTSFASHWHFSIVSMAAFMPLGGTSTTRLPVRNLAAVLNLNVHAFFTSSSRRNEVSIRSLSTQAVTQNTTLNDGERSPGEILEIAKSSTVKKIRKRRPKDEEINVKTAVSSVEVRTTLQETVLVSVLFLRGAMIWAGTMPPRKTNIVSWTTWDVLRRHDTPHTTTC